MRYASFTRTIPLNTRVFVNPLQVVAVDTFSNYTNIHTTVPRSDGSGCVIISVVQPENEVVTALQNALNG
ncbi:hypothetical protein [Sinorhizobium americanum]|uniref:Uncharacterized protein n=1 Tax=Sinorhizobium americanum TaxID=194963 RepID=A0A1L3LM14_9HYPH|nr:hypothetical protein [Sinorhizobium americanum]APG91140.1 hypothetical protein SAMCFNEI73_Ch1851 [Sinorhizobium americanum]OAP43721.1 hypothetical protein ATC00_02445 [Sinorhizobium americanum]